jgi:hypothetical protein
MMMMMMMRQEEEEEEEEEEDEDEDDEEDDDDEEDGDDEDDVIITSGLQHSLKIRNFASNSSYCNATNNYNNNDDDASSSSNHSAISDGSGGVSNDDYEDNDDDAKDANHKANNDDATNGNESSICDGTHSKEDYTSLSCTNQSFQPNVSASESSSFIGPHRNPQWNACSKVKTYDIGEEPSSDEENECSISDECVSSVGGSSGSITSRPDSFKSITKSSFNGVSRQPVLGRSIIGPVLNLHHAAPPPREDSLRRNLGAPKNIATQSLTMAVKALRLL